MDKISYGLTLSGDGARSFAHIGVYKALEEFGIKPEVISGTSMGAVIGAFIASGYSAIELEKIIPDILKSTKLLSNIVTASQEQQSGVQSINTSIIHLTNTTNQNSASAQEMSARAEELSAQAKKLEEIVSIFKME